MPDDTGTPTGTATVHTTVSELQELLDHGIPMPLAKRMLADKSNPSPLLSAALNYAARGWHVFPLQSDSKDPRAKEELSVNDLGKEGGFKVATDNPLTIRFWWAKWPRANIGIATGASHLAVLDMDVKEGKRGKESLAALLEEIGQEHALTLCAITPSGGQHFYYTIGDNSISSSADKLAPGLDVRARGGYVVAPPSQIKGQEYRWHNEGIELLPFPAVIAERLIKPLDDATAAGNVKDDPDYWLNQALVRAQVGNRNATGFALACQLRDCGMAKDQAELVMLRYVAGTPTGSSPYEASEALASLESAYAQPAREPAKDLSTTPPEKKKKRLCVEDYVDALIRLGYQFRLNEAGDILEINGHRMDDFHLSTIRAHMRARGFTNAGAVEDIVKMIASQNRYHPIKDYLIIAGASWDRGAHIDALASHFEDITSPYPLFSVWLRKWLIGAVAKAIDGQHNQNAMLVLDGPQGIGKSHFAQWLCSPLPDYFVESSINPDDKDSWIRLASYWIWEVGELGATTRRADVEALKAFVSERVVTVRRPFARLDMIKPALSSLIGTINDSGGFLSDPTGNRRFLVAKINKIDWDYASTLNPQQIWGEAFAAYTSGEDWRLNADERARSEENNETYKVPNVLEGYLAKYFNIDPRATENWMATAAVIDRLQVMGYRDSGARSMAMQVAATLCEMGLVKAKAFVNGRRVWGYEGIEPTIFSGHTQPI